MNAQYQHEHKVIIDEYHRDAFRAGQIRMAGRDKLGWIASLVTRISTSITALMAVAGRWGNHEPAVGQDTVAYGDLVEEPAPTAVVAGSTQ
jgi:hypothetical protein